MSFYELNSQYRVKKHKDGRLIAYYLDEPVSEIKKGTPLRRIMEDMVKAVNRSNVLYEAYQDHPGAPFYFKDVEQIDITLSDGTRFVEKGSDDDDLDDFSRYVFILKDGTEVPGDQTGLAFFAAYNLQGALNVIEALENFEKDPVREISLQITIRGQTWALREAFGDEVFEKTDLLRSAVVDALTYQLDADQVSFQANVQSITDVSEEADLEPDDDPRP